MEEKCFEGESYSFPQLELSLISSTASALDGRGFRGLADSCNNHVLASGASQPMCCSSRAGAIGPNTDRAAGQMKEASWGTYEAWKGADESFKYT